MIGAIYQYYDSDRLFRLTEIDNFIYRFECGHWCTDCVFNDLYIVRLF